MEKLGICIKISEKILQDLLKNMTFYKKFCKFLKQNGGMAYLLNVRSRVQRLLVRKDTAVVLADLASTGTVVLRKLFPKQNISNFIRRGTVEKVSFLNDYGAELKNETLRHFCVFCICQCLSVVFRR